MLLVVTGESNEAGVAVGQVGKETGVAVGDVVGDEAKKAGVIVGGCFW